MKTQEIAGKPGDLREKMADIMTEVSWAKIANRHFGRSPSWIYHKMDGIDGNGGSGGFTAAELDRFREALYDLAGRIKSAADSL